MSDKDHQIDGKVYEITNKSTGNVVYSYIIKTHESDGVYIMLTADNLDTLKIMVETFKLKQLNSDNYFNETTDIITNNQKFTKDNSTRFVEKNSEGVGVNPYEDENCVGEDDNSYYFSDSGSYGE